MVNQFIGVLDTTVKIVSGAVVGGLFTLGTILLKQRNERRRERKRRREEKTIDPILLFVDEYLVALTTVYFEYVKAYSEHVEMREASIEKVLMFKYKEGMIESRIAELKNEKLSRDFKKLTLQLNYVSGHLEEKKIKQAHDELNEAYQLAGDVRLQLNALLEPR